MLVLQLNPAVPLRPGTVGALVLPLLLLHGTLFALVFYTVLLAADSSGRDGVCRPGG